MTLLAKVLGARFQIACLPVAVAVAIAGVSSSAHATNYFEWKSGDLSGSSAAPTDIHDLTLGSNVISGSTFPSGAVIPNSHGERVHQDNDYVSFTVPEGDELEHLYIGSDTQTGIKDDGSILSGDRFFFGIAKGYGVSVPSDFSSAKGLLGWTLGGEADVNTDVLGALGEAAPKHFPPIPGATKFSGPLGPGVYSLWIVDGDAGTRYGLDLAVGEAPEPATWIMLLAGVGVAGLTLRRRTVAGRRAVA